MVDARTFSAERQGRMNPRARLVWLLLAPLLHGCAQAAASEVRLKASEPPARHAAPEPRSTLDAGPSKSEALAEAPDRSRAKSDAATERAARCPEGMVLLSTDEGEYCIDRYEASLERGRGNRREAWPGNRAIDDMEDEFEAVSKAGVKPQGYISGEQASQVCRNAGKRLCGMDEWLHACRGPERTRYPYGNDRRPNLCNDRFKTLDRHPVVRLFYENAPKGTDPALMWTPSWMNDPRLHELSDSVAPSGSFAACTNDYGVYDMVGNLHEWVADPSGTFVGGFFMDTYQNGEGCEYRTEAHAFHYHDYSTGFRCCADPTGE